MIRKDWKERRKIAWVGGEMDSQTGSKGDWY